MNLENDTLLVEKEHASEETHLDAVTEAEALTLLIKHTSVA